MPAGCPAGAKNGRRWNTLDSETGSSLIELALVLPVFLLLLFGFINFALIMFGICNQTYASRAALRYACIHSGTSYAPASMADINNIVNPFLFKYPANTAATTVSYANGNNTVGSTVGIAIRVTYNISLPGYKFNGLTLSSSASGVIVQ